MRPLPSDLFLALRDVLRHPAGRGDEILYVPLLGAAHLLSADRVRALAACDARLAGLDRHAARIASRAGIELAHARAHARALAEAGLLVPASDLLQRLRRAAGGAPPPKIASLGIVTRDHPDELRACLESFLEDSLSRGRTLEYVVAEGEVSAEARASTQARLGEIAARRGVVIFHLGVPEKAAYAAVLAKRAGVPRDVVEFALLNPERCPIDTGASHNALLLHGAGELSVHVDDDTRCHVAPVPGQAPGLTLTSQHDPSESWFPALGEPARLERARGERGFVEIHEQLLGWSVGAVVEEAGGELEIDQTSGMFFHRLQPGRVLYTQMGSAGDTGTGSMWHYLVSRGATRERLHVSEASYRRAFCSRQAIRGPVRASISDNSSCMSMAVGLDGREVLPPFFPVQRNGDGVFGGALRVCRFDAFAGFAPWLIEHAPSRPRATSFEAFWAGLSSTASNDMVCALIGASRIEADKADPERSLRALGEALAQRGARSPAAFDEAVRLEVLHARSVDISLLEGALAEHRATPSYWARDVERTAHLVREAMAWRGLTTPADLERALGEREARAVMQRAVRRYGELLQCWPEMMAAARALRAEGVRPGVRVGTP